MAAAFLTFAVAGGDAGAHSEQGLLALTAEVAGESTTPMTLRDESEGRYRGELLLPSDGKWE